MRSADQAGFWLVWCLVIGPLVVAGMVHVAQLATRRLAGRVPELAEEPPWPPAEPPPARDAELTGWQRRMVRNLAAETGRLPDAHARNGRTLADMLRRDNDRPDAELARDVLVILEFAAEASEVSESHGHAFAAVHGALAVAAVELSALDLLA